MDSRNSWIDRREIKDLLRQLMPDQAPSVEPEEASPPSIHRGDFITLPGPQTPAYDDSPASPPERSEAELREEALRSLNSIHPFTTGAFAPGDTDLPHVSRDSASPFPSAPSRPLPPAPSAPPPSAPSPSAPDFELPRGPLGTRLQAFADWVAEVTGSTQILITDAQGYSLLDADAPEDAQTASSALQLLEALERFRNRMRSDAARAGLYLPVGPDEWFGVVECESSLGPVCLSLIIPAPLSASAAQEIARVLRLTLES